MLRLILREKSRQCFSLTLARMSKNGMYQPTGSWWWMVLRLWASVSCRYHKLIWGPHSMTSGDRVSGVLIAGGENGNVILYDSAKIIDGEAEVIIAQKDKHTGPVRALDVNMFQVGFWAVSLNIPSTEEWPILTHNLKCYCCFPSPEKHELYLMFECLYLVGRTCPIIGISGW